MTTHRRPTTLPVLIIDHLAQFTEPPKPYSAFTVNMIETLHPRYPDIEVYAAIASLTKRQLVASYDIDTPTGPEQYVRLTQPAAAAVLPEILQAMDDRKNRPAGLSIRNVTEDLGLSPSTARRVVHYLIEQGAVTATSHHGGGRGRPTDYYSLSAAGKRMFRDLYVPAH